MNSPKVSVVIPTFNRAHLIQRAIFSAVNQEMAGIEVVVVDDGSTDNTEEVVKNLNLENVKYIKKENGGVSSARNAGIKNASGEYIALLDSDDLLRSWSVPYRASFLDKHPEYDGIAGGVMNINKDFQVHQKMYNQLLDQEKKDSEWRSFKQKEALSYARTKEEFFKLCQEYMVNTKGGIPYTTSSTMIKRKSLLDNNLFYNENLRNSEDLDFIYRCAKLLNIKYDIIRMFAYVQFQDDGLTKNLKNGLALNQQSEVLSKIIEEYNTRI